MNICITAPPTLVLPPPNSLLSPHTPTPSLPRHLLPHLNKWPIRSSFNNTWRTTLQLGKIEDKLGWGGRGVELPTTRSIILLIINKKKFTENPKGMACLCHLSPNSERRTHEQNCEPNQQCEWNQNSPKIIQGIFKSVLHVPCTCCPQFTTFCFPLIWDRTSHSFPALSGRLIMAPFQWETVRSGCPVKPSQANMWPALMIPSTPNKCQVAAKMRSVEWSSNRCHAY